MYAVFISTFGVWSCIGEDAAIRVLTEQLLESNRVRELRQAKVSRGASKIIILHLAANHKQNTWTVPPVGHTELQVNTRLILAAQSWLQSYVIQFRIS